MYISNSFARRSEYLILNIHVYDVSKHILFNRPIIEMGTE